MPLAQACLTSENPYQRKGGLMCLAVLAEGCADHIRTKYVQLTEKSFISCRTYVLWYGCSGGWLLTVFRIWKYSPFVSMRVRMLSSMLQTVCQSLSDSNQVVRSAGLFALGQFSEHLQVSQHSHHSNITFIFFFCFDSSDMRLYMYQWIQITLQCSISWHWLTLIQVTSYSSVWLENDNL